MKNKERKIINNIIKYMIVALSGEIAFLFDLKYFNDNTANLNNIVGILLTAISVLFTIVFSYMLFLKQRFYYNSGTLKKENINIIDLLLLFILGLIIILFNKYLYVTEIYYCIICLIYIIMYTVILSKNMKSNELSKLLKLIAIETKKRLKKKWAKYNK